jgi:hypothetical protein
MKIDEIWLELESDQSFHSGILYKRFSSSVNPDFYVALRSPEKFRCLATLINKSNEPEVKNWSHLKDIKVEIFHDEKNPEKSFLLILLLNQQFNDIFSVLCEDLIFQVQKISDENELINKVLNRLAQWETLFENIGQQGLSTEAQRGLYGELFFLRKFLKVSEKFELCINSWLGPSKAVQDFQYGSWAVEVKTTHGNNHQKIHISSERQLDNRLIPEIYLFHISLDSRSNYGESLNEIINAVRKMLSDNISALNSFNLKLHESGYFDIHAKIYENTGYSIRQENFYIIGDGFPRITESSIMPSVGDVKYSIIISDCQSFCISEKDLFTRLNF